MPLSEKDVLVSTDAAYALIVNDQGIIEFVGKQIIDTLGWLEEELAGKAADTFIFLPPRLSFTKLLNRVRDKQTGSNYLVSFLSSTGTFLTEPVTVSQVTDHGQSKLVLRFFPFTRKAHDANIPARARTTNQLITEIASGFIDSDLQNLKHTIEIGLAKTARFTNFERATLSLFANNYTQRRVAYQFHHKVESLDAFQEQEVALDFSRFKWWKAQLLASKNVILSSIEDLPAEAGHEYRELKRLNTRSVLAVPVFHQQNIVGYLTFSSFNYPVSTNEEILNFIQLMASLFGNALNRLAMHQELTQSKRKLEEQESHTTHLQSQLQEKEWQYRLVAENACDLIILTDADENMVYISPATQVLLGYSVEEFKEQGWNNIVHPDDHDLFHRFIRQAVAHPNSPEVDFEFRALHKNEQVVWIESRARVVEEAGEVYYLAVLRDCTARKKAEEENKRHQAYLLALLNAGQQGIFAIDRDFKLIFYNEYHRQQFNQMFGKGDPRVGEDLFFYEDNQELIKSLRATYDPVFKGETRTQEIHMPNSDGTHHWGEYFMAPIQIDGEVIGAMVCARNITDRKEIQEHLENTNFRLQLATDAAQIGIWEYNVLTENLIWDDNMFRIFDYTHARPASMKYDFWFSKVHPEDAERAKREAQECIIYQHTFDTSFRILNRSGDVRYIKAFGRPVVDQEGKTVKLIGVNYDISEIKWAEQQTREKNRELGKINSELDQFVYSTSHNLRAPLTSVLGLVEVLRLQLQGNSEQEYLAMMEKSIRRLDETIHEILDYSRNSRVGITVSAVNLTDLIEDTIQSLQYLQETRKVKITYQVQGDAVFFSDERRLRAIFSNLVSNAIKYQNMNIENPFLNVLMVVNEHEALIRFEDNGIGVAEEQLEKIFTMFFRGVNQSSGSGLGLYIVKEIVDKLNGNLAIDSELHKGTCFTLSIPNQQ